MGGLWRSYQVRDVENVDVETAQAREGEADQIAKAQSKKKEAMVDWCKTSLVRICEPCLHRVNAYIY